MKKRSHRISQKTKDRLIRFFDGILSATSLMTVLMAASFISGIFSSKVYFFVSFLAMAGSKILQAILAYKKDRISFIKNLCFAALLAGAGAYQYIAGISLSGAIVMLAVFFVVVISNRVLSIVKKHKLRNIPANVIFILFFGFCLFELLFANDDSLEELLLLVSILVGGYSLGHIISVSFSQMRLGVLQKIIRKTFAVEILFGLLLLMASFSFIFEAMEPNIPTYLDALWYCFAVVTTIGFGDFTVVGALSRVLTVILGIYGIIVVALITSIIINFYNEVKDRDDDEDKKEVQAEEEKTDGQTTLNAENGGDGRT